MVPPKYNHYIGKELDVPFYENRYTIAADGTVTTGAGLIGSDFVNIEEYTYLYVNCIGWGSGNNICEVVFLDSDSKPTGFRYLKPQAEEFNPKTIVIEIPKGTKYAAFNYNNTCTEFMSYFNANKGFIYGLNTITPHYTSLSKKYAKESKQEFFRESLDGKITLFGDDYKLIENSSIEDNLIYIINKLHTQLGFYKVYYIGTFNKIDGKLDYDKKSYELKTSPFDAYTNILNGYDSTYDIIKLAPEITKINMHKRILMQVYIAGSNSIMNFFGGTYWEADVNETVDVTVDEVVEKKGALINKYHFAYITTGNEVYVNNAGITGVNGVYAGTDCTLNNWNGYTLYHEDGHNLLKGTYYCIKRNSDNAILYKSAKAWAGPEENDFIGREDIEMVNVNNANDKFTISSPFTYHVYQRLLCDVPAMQEGSEVKFTSDIPVDDFVTDNRNYKKCIGLTGGYFFCTSRTVSEPTKYGLNDYGEYFTNKFLAYSSGFGRPLPICRSTWANASMWYVYNDLSYAIFEEALRKSYTLKDSYSIAAIIKVLLNKIDPTLTHEATSEYSQFLYGDNLPVFNMTNRFYVYLTPKSNILKGDYDQAAQKGEITLEELMNMLRDCFRCYWFIEDNKFKIEHISYFMKGGSYSGSNNIQLDTTTLKDQFNKKLYQYFQSAIEFDKSELASRYEFAWADDATEVFSGPIVEVKSSYVQKDLKEEVNVSSFSSDVDFMIACPENFSSDGFALLCPIKNGSKYELPIVAQNLIDSEDSNYEAIAQNFYASWKYLLRFYMYDLSAENIEINEGITYYSPYSVKKCKQHEISLPIAEDLKAFKLIKTSIGSGMINEMSINLDTRIAKIELVYNPN